MSSPFDDFTPREVWAEYARRKAALDPSMGATEYHDAVARVAAELGCGVPWADLSDAQREAQRDVLAEAQCGPAGRSGRGPSPLPVADMRKEVES